MKRVFFLACALIICLTLPASAHKGRTDANGGHYDHSTGEYHYHHGYPAHQHVNGICPYDFDDKTNHDSGGTSSSSVAAKSNRSVGSSGGPDIPAEWIGFAAGLSVVGLLVFWYVYLRYNEWKDAKLKREEEYRKLSQRCLRLEEENRQLQEKFQRETQHLQKCFQQEKRQLQDHFQEETQGLQERFQQEKQERREHFQKEREQLRVTIDLLKADKSCLCHEVKILHDEIHVLRLKVKQTSEISDDPMVEVVADPSAGRELQRGGR